MVECWNATGVTLASRDSGRLQRCAPTRNSRGSFDADRPAWRPGSRTATGPREERTTSTSGGGSEVLLPRTRSLDGRRKGKGEGGVNDSRSPSPNPFPRGEMDRQTMLTLRPWKRPFPSARAKRVSSSPQPKFRPAWDFVPHRRMMMLPVLTRWPPKTFTPRYWALVDM